MAFQYRIGIAAKFPLVPGPENLKTTSHTDNPELDESESSLPGYKNNKRSAYGFHEKWRTGDIRLMLTGCIEKRGFIFVERSRTVNSVVSPREKQLLRQG